MFAGLFSFTPKDPLLRRVKTHFAGLDQNRPLEEYEFVVLDTELTGLNPRRDEIVSIGAVRIRKLAIEPEEQFYSLVEPKIPAAQDLHPDPPHHAAASQGTTPPASDIAPPSWNSSATPLLWGTTLGWTSASSTARGKRILGDKLQTPCLDTMRLAQVYEEALFEGYYDQYRQHISYNLRDLAKHYGLPLFPQHNALQDALQTAYLFLFLVKKLQGFRLLTLRQLYMAGRSWKWYL